MELHERVKILRKKYLKLSQEAFGEKLGVSRSVINNIERNVLARPEQKEPLYKLICKIFNVNQNWLLNGTEPIFIEPDTFNLDEYLKSKDADNLEIEIIKTYFDLPKDVRDIILNHFKNNLLTKDINKYAKKESLETINHNTLVDDDDDIKKELEAYRLELIAEKKGKTLSVSEDTKIKKAY